MLLIFNFSSFSFGRDFSVFNFLRVLHLTHDVKFKNLGRVPCKMSKMIVFVSIPTRFLGNLLHFLGEIVSDHTKLRTLHSDIHHRHKIVVAHEPITIGVSGFYHSLNFVIFKVLTEELEDSVEFSDSNKTAAISVENLEGLA